MSGVGVSAGFAVVDNTVEIGRGKVKEQSYD
jgi:hypothetical protein